MALGVGTASGTGTTMGTGTSKVTLELEPTRGTGTGVTLRVRSGTALPTRSSSDPGTTVVTVLADGTVIPR